MTSLASKMNRRNNNLNQIQFLAAIAVLYSHAFPIGYGINDGELIKELSGYRFSFGILSMCIFFIISGFLVVQSYQRKDSFVSYIKNRIIRIYPAFAATIVLSALVLGPILSTLSTKEYFASASTWDYFKNLFPYPMYWELPGVFANNPYGASINGSLWTLPFQFALYFAVGLLGLAGLLRYKKTSLFLFITAIILYICQKTVFAGTTHFLLLPIDSWMYLCVVFTAGMVASAYAEYISLTKQGAMLCTVCWLIAFFAGEYFVSTAILGTYLILYFGYSENIKLEKFASISKMSFGVYVYGFPVQQTVVMLFGGKMNPTLNFAISLPIVLLLAFLSWHLIEKPTLKLKDIVLFANIVPQTVKNKYKSIRAKYLHFLDSLRSINWITFIAVIVVAALLFSWNSRTPTRADFNSSSTKGYGIGWFFQSGVEGYRFVTDVSQITLLQKSGKNTLKVQGFIPENIKEVKQLDIYVNEKKVHTIKIDNSKRFSAEIELEETGKILGNKLNIRLAFDGKHIPGEGELDIREISAAMTQIEIS